MSQLLYVYFCCLFLLLSSSVIKDSISKTEIYLGILSRKRTGAQNCWQEQKGGVALVRSEAKGSYECLCIPLCLPCIIGNQHSHLSYLQSWSLSCIMILMLFIVENNLNNQEPRWLGMENLKLDLVYDLKWRLKVWVLTLFVC